MQRTQALIKVLFRGWLVSEIDLKGAATVTEGVVHKTITSSLELDLPLHTVSTFKGNCLLICRQRWTTKP